MKKIIPILFCIVFLLTSCINKENQNNEEQQSSSSDTYSTNEYEIYREFTQTVANTNTPKLAYIGEESINNKVYYVYEAEDVRVQVEKREVSQIQTEYIIIQNGVKLFTTIQPNIHKYYPSEELVIYYVDITKDNNKDIIIKGQPGSGTGTNHYWSFAYNLEKKTEISLFEKGGYPNTITQEQQDQLLKMLEKDDNFQKLFEGYEAFLGYAEPFIDPLGDVYFRMSITKNLTDSMGEIFILFEYNKVNNCFDVSNYLYMPK